MFNIPGNFLRRPFSIHDVNLTESSISFLYKIVGKGTKALSQMKPGTTIQLLGPLGNGYKLNNIKKKYKNYHKIIIAGGSGIASMYFLAAKLNSIGTLYYGVYSKKDLICLDQFNQIKWKIVVASEDGTIGHQGSIVNVVENVLKKNDIIFACGPYQMLKTLQDILYKKHIHGFLSLESIMACGTGICQGCTTIIHNTPQKICTDGPIFEI
jgi:dihydroorotate dehydrogenase electron transfer subunit